MCTTILIVSKSSHEPRLLEIAAKSKPTFELLKT